MAASTPPAAFSVPAQQARAAFTGTGRIAQVCDALCWQDLEMAEDLVGRCEDLVGRCEGCSTPFLIQKCPASLGMSVVLHIDNLFLN